MQDSTLLRLSFAAAVVLLVPGGALLAWLNTTASRQGSARAHRDLLSNLVDAAALSISLSAILALFAFIIGLRAGASGLIVLYLAFLAAVFAAVLWRWSGLPDGAQILSYVGVLLLSVLFIGGLAAWRLYQARTLALPAWVDPVHHTLAVRLILERGGIPPDLQPLTPAPFVFHFGFHLITALFAFWSGAAQEQAVLWFGQLLNAGVALSVYRLAVALFAGSEPVDAAQQLLPPLPSAIPVVAALLVGFVFQMPAYYLTWGRFTLLAGLLILGPLMAAALEARDDPTRPATWVRLAILIAGLALTHIFALLLAGLFLAILWIAQSIHSFRHAEGGSFIWRMVVAGLVGLLAAAPWFWWAHDQSGLMANVKVNPIVQADENARKQALDYLRYVAYLIGPRRSHILFGIAGVGLLFSMREPRRRSLIAWALLLALFSLPWGLTFEPFRPDYFAITLFFPAALLLAALLVDASAALARATRVWVGWLALALVTALMLAWGVRETKNVINPVTVLGVPADARALAWVRENTPPDARFYINSALWLGNVYRGVDGGYWLEPAAGRVSLVPPSFYTYGDPQYVANIRRWADQATRINGCTAEFWQVVQEAGLTHVYLREGQGSLQPAALADCPRLQLVYQAEGVHIYAILP